MIHEEEICYWSKHANGTTVWARPIEGEGDWIKGMPAWYEEYCYVVDNEWAELRMAQIDGRKLQKVFNGKWEDTYLLISSTSTSIPSDWRVKPVEPIYEYQWILKKEGMSRWTMTNYWYFVGEEITESKGWEKVEPFRPSKRKRNEQK